MWFKAVYFLDYINADNILKSTSPNEAKMYGREVKGYDDGQWISVREYYMFLALDEKFSQNEELKGYLLSTKDKFLIEASPYDKIWGVGLSIDNLENIEEGVNFKDIFKGQNLLGEVLMNIRWRCS